MEQLHGRMSRHVVTIRIGGDDDVTYDGTVLSSSQDCLYVIASSVFGDKIDNTLIEMRLPNGRWITIGRNCFDVVENEDSGILGIRCMNPTPGDDCGFGDLEPINICEDVVQEQQTVYTYSRHFKQKLLTPGSIMLVQENSFDLDCARYLETHNGAPVVNAHAQLVGLPFSHKGYLTAYNMREVAARIERNQGRQLKRMSITFQHLRQQCRVIEFRLRGSVVQCKIQRIGQPVTSASWVNLEEFRQQHPTFQVEEEIENEIEQHIQLAVDNPFKGRYYVRRGIKIFGNTYPNGAWGELKRGVASHISGNLVALASFNGESKLFACTGFFIDYYADKRPAILTSASLVRNLDGTIIEGLRIMVLLPNNERCEGKLEHCSLHYNVALVSVKNYDVDCPANLKHRAMYYSTKVVAVGRCFEPDLMMAASGKCTRWSGKLDCNDLHYTTCTITKAGIGGPLVNVNGKFVGMNYYDRNMGTPYLRFDLLYGILNYFKTGVTKYEKLSPDSRLPGREAHIVKDGEKQPPNRWIWAGQSEDMDQGEEASKNERVAIADPNRYGYRNGDFTVYK